MKTILKWMQKMAFEGKAGINSFKMDSKKPIGDESAPTPKELLASAIAGCSAMDIVGLMKKYKEPLETFEVETDVTLSEGSHPVVFTQVNLTYNASGPVTKEKLIEAVHLSQTKYCSVSAMMSKAVPIHYRIVLNAEEIAKGQADFK